MKRMIKASQYQYKGYTIQETSDQYIIRDGSGKSIGYRDTSKEAENFIEELIGGSDDIKASTGVSDIIGQLEQSGVQRHAMRECVLVELGDGSYGVVLSDVNQGDVIMSICTDQASAIGIDEIANVITQSWE